MEFIRADTHYLDKTEGVKFIPECIQTKLADPICSVVITNFNYGKYLKEALDSVLKQTLNALEVIIVDDGSTDPESVHVVKSCIGLNRVKVIFKQNEKLPAARNTGIAVAKGKYICAMDADDLFHSTYLEQCIFEMESHDNLGFVFSWVHFFGDENRIWATQNFNIDVAMEKNTTCGSAVFRKSDWVLAGGYNEKMNKGFEDWEFWLRIAQLGRCGKVIPTPLFLYRRHGITMSHGSENMRDILVSDIARYQSDLFSNPVWLDVVRRYTGTVSPSQFPVNLIACINQTKQAATKPVFLVILPWEQMGKEELFLTSVLSSMKEKYEFIVVTMSYQVFSVTHHFSSIASAIYYYGNALPNDQSHFLYFVSYLIASRSVEYVLGAEEIFFYTVLPTLKTIFPSVGFFDFVSSAFSSYFNQSKQHSGYLAQHFCFDKSVVESFKLHAIDESKLMLLQKE